MPTCYYTLLFSYSMTYIYIYICESMYAFYGPIVPVIKTVLFYNIYLRVELLQSCHARVDQPRHHT